MAYIVLYSYINLYIPSLLQNLQDTYIFSTFSCTSSLIQFKTLFCGFYSYHFFFNFKYLILVLSYPGRAWKTLLVSLAVLETWGMWSTTSLPLFPSPIQLVVLVRVPSMDQIGPFKIIFHRTMCKEKQLYKNINMNI